MIAIFYLFFFLFFLFFKFDNLTDPEMGLFILYVYKWLFPKFTGLP